MWVGGCEGVAVYTQEHVYTSTYTYTPKTYTHTNSHANTHMYPPKKPLPRFTPKQVSNHHQSFSTWNNFDWIAPLAPPPPQAPPPPPPQTPPLSFHQQWTACHPVWQRGPHNQNGGWGGGKGNMSMWGCMVIWCLVYCVVCCLCCLYLCGMYTYVCVVLIGQTCVPHMR